jgi:xylulokinase
MGLFLGLDSSTQSLSAMVVDTDRGAVVLEESLNFGKTLPEYGSQHGFLLNSDSRIKHANPVMWVQALDVLLGRITAGGFDLGTIAGVSGAAQQHGSVYLRQALGRVGGRSPSGRLADDGWSSETPLHEQLRPLFSRATAPIWLDASTGEECREIAAALGGEPEVVKVSGSRAIERFTAAQIRRFYKLDPAAYEATQEIQLVSSFIASLLAGHSVPIDHGDGAGMNLLDLSTGAWSPELLAATAPGLDRRLRAPVPSTTQVGVVAGYFVRQYGFRAGTPLFAFTGDNPSSLVGMGASQPGIAVISLGTSDTVFAAMREPRTDPRGFGHVFGNPAGGFMSLICFANGSLAREGVKDRFGLSWQDFDRAIRDESRPGNEGNAMLPFFVPEMTPKITAPKVELFGDAEFLAWRKPAATVRAIVEAQAVSMKRHSDWIGETPSSLLVTGGASRNLGILQIIADVFQAELRALSVGNSSALGGALRAAHAVEGTSFRELARVFAAPDPNLHVRPNPATRALYAELEARFVERLQAL